MFVLDVLYSHRVPSKQESIVVENLFKISSLRDVYTIPKNISDIILYKPCEFINRKATG